IYLVETDTMEEASHEIIDAFDRIIPTFYDPSDRETGFITSIDRQGIKRTFDIMTISIGITDTKTRSFSHYGEITERASEMKKFAKHFKGSCFKTDKRKN
ncbi:MAG: diguanylate cyclase response regulator, partial [Deltaproteobacteria bacterium]|nr:diguanylate cyclase response regulator [Deltaproteobacteria bacterium]